MGKFTRNLIEYSGVELVTDNCCMIKKSDSFKQTTIDINLCVPDEKPDIEQVVKVSIKTNIEKYTIVKTPVGISEEGQEITGYKLLLMGDFIIKIAYVADVTCQSMHSFHVIVPFCEYIVMPKDFSPLSIVTPEVYVEDIYVRQQDCRCLFGNITFMAIADIC